MAIDIRGRVVSTLVLSTITFDIRIRGRGRGEERAVVIDLIHLGQY